MPVSVAAAVAHPVSPAATAARVAVGMLAKWSALVRGGRAACVIGAWGWPQMTDPLVSRLLQAVATFDRSHPTGAGTPTGRPPPPAAPAATRAAVSLAHPVVVASPSSSTTAPHPAVIHQPAWLAVAKLVRSSPWMPAVATAPTTATPRDWPTCRLVEAMAAATPACARGMPETAVLVLGAFTRPNPAPKTT